MAKIMLWMPGPWAKTGYGTQGLKIAKMLRDGGHEVIIFAYAGLTFGEVTYEGFRVLPNNSQDYGNTYLQIWNNFIKPDVIIQFFDAWVLGDLFSQVKDKVAPIYSLAPVDHSPCPPPLVKSLKGAAKIIAMTHFAERSFKEVGLTQPIVYIPHCVNSAVFTPGDKTEARKKIGLPEDGFIVTSVATNKGPRKCVVPGTLIVTKDKIKPIEEVKVGDEVLTHKGRFKKVKEVMANQYHGKLIGIRPFGINQTLWLTPDHPVLVSKKENPYPSRLLNRPTTMEWMPAAIVAENYKRVMVTTPIIRDATKRHQVLHLKKLLPESVASPFSIKSANKRGKSLPRCIVPDKEWMQLFGYYIAEGAGSKGAIELYFNRTEKSLITQAYNALKSKVGSAAIIQRDEKGVFGGTTSATMVYSCHKLLLTLLRQIFGQGARNKIIPPWFMQFPKDKLLFLWTAMHEGDGNIYSPQRKTSNTQVGYKTSSQSLSLTVPLLLHKLGVAPNWQQKDGGKYYISVAGTQVEELGIPYNGKHKKQSSYNDGRFAYYGIKEVETRTYSGLVYNLEVEDDESYVANFITVHNCLGNVLLAFHDFLGKIPEARKNAYLYLHCNIHGHPRNPHGYNLPEIWRNLGIADRIKVTHPDFYEAIGFSEAEMADLYRSADWVILTSMGEGFGLPLAESLNCGVPLIYSNHSSLPEVVGPGGLPVDPIDRIPFELSSSFQWLPSTKMITQRFCEGATACA